jgi:hypothetical protein
MSDPFPKKHIELRGGKALCDRNIVRLVSLAEFMATPRVLQCGQCLRMYAHALASKSKVPYIKGTMTRPSK